MGGPARQYVVWFRDHAVPADDPSSEWCACLIIVAADGDAALAWGDQLAADYCRRWSGCEFLRSYLDPDEWVDASVPRVVAGQDTSDEVIGW